LKALLEEAGASFSKTHDLEALLGLLPSQFGSLARYGRGMRFLTEFAVDPRYPLLRTNKRQALAAVRWAGKIRQESRNLLGL